MLKKICVMLAATLLVGCAAVEKQAFNKTAHQNVKRITLIEPKPATGFGVQVLNHPALGFGLIGLSIYSAEMATKSSTLDSAMKPFGWSLSDEISQRLTAALIKQGYEVNRLKVERDLTLIKDFAALKSDPRYSEALATDAYLDLSTRDPLYVANGPTADYMPSVVATVRLVSSTDFALLYREDIMYGFAYPLGRLEPVVLNSDQKYRFPTMDDLIKNPKFTFEGVSEGIAPVVNRIALDLARQ